MPCRGCFALAHALANTLAIVLRTSERVHTTSYNTCSSQSSLCVIRHRTHMYTCMVVRFAGTLWTHKAKIVLRLCAVCVRCTVVAADARCQGLFGGVPAAVLSHSAATFVDKTVPSVVPTSFQGYPSSVPGTSQGHLGRQAALGACWAGVGRVFLKHSCDVFPLFL